MARFRLQVLTPGTWVVGRNPDGTPRTHTFTVEDSRNFASQGNAMLQSGINVPVCWEHQDRQRPGRLSKDDWAKEKALGTTGWAERYLVSKSTGAAFAEVEIPDEADAKKAEVVRFCSPEIDKFQDGSSKDWGTVFTHLALTPRPVQHGQAPILRLGHEDLMRLAIDPMSGKELESLDGDDAMPKSKAAHEATQKSGADAMSYVHATSKAALAHAEKGEHEDAAKYHEQASKLHQDHVGASVEDSDKQKHTAAMDMHGEAAKAQKDCCKGGRMGLEDLKKPKKDGEAEGGDGETPPAETAAPPETPPTPTEPAVVPVVDPDLPRLLKALAANSLMVGSVQDIKEVCIALEAIAANGGANNLQPLDDDLEEVSPGMGSGGAATPMLMSTEAQTRLSQLTSENEQKSARLSLLEGKRVADKRINLKQRLDRLLATGRIAMVDYRPRAEEPTKIQLSVDAAGEVPGGTLELWIEAREGLPKNSIFPLDGKQNKTRLSNTKVIEQPVAMLSDGNGGEVMTPEREKEIRAASRALARGEPVPA